MGRPKNETNAGKKKTSFMISDRCRAAISFVMWYTGAANYSVAVEHAIVGFVKQMAEEKGLSDLLPPVLKEYLE